MIDDELRGKQRVDALGIAAHLHHRIAHGGEIHDRRHAGEVLEEHPRGHERDFFVGQLEGLPAYQLLDVLGPYDAAILATQQVLEHDLERIGKPGDGETASLQRIEPEDLVAATCCLQRGPSAEAVGTHCGSTFTATTKYSVSPKQVVGMPLCCW